MLLTISLTLTISIAFFICLYLINKKIRAQANQLSQLEQQLSGLCAAAVGADERVVKFEQALHKIKEQHNTMSLGPLQQQGYEHAIRLARKGVAIEQIIDNCNLSDEEARLISRLHGLQGHGGELH